MPFPLNVIFNIARYVLGESFCLITKKQIIGVDFFRKENQHL